MNKLIPELVESLLVSFKHVPHVQVQGMGCVPLLQLVEVGVLRESHVVQERACCAPLCSSNQAE